MSVLVRGMEIPESCHDCPFIDEQRNGAFDRFALEMGHDILTGEVLEKYGNNEAKEET